MIRSKERIAFDTASHLRDNLLSSWKRIRQKKGTFFFYEMARCLHLHTFVIQFWHTHTYGGGTGRTATLK
jgi:hypothetical protein